MGSIISALKFEAYKIDEVNFEMQKIVELLQFKGVIDPESWKLDIKIRNPFFIKKDKKYIGGIQTSLWLEPEKDETSEGEKHTNEGQPDSEQDKKPNFLIKCNIGITGIFSVEEGRFKKETENDLVKLQIPTILFPYIRTTITSLLANAGFGSIILPLINIQEVARRTANLEVQVLE